MATEVREVLNHSCGRPASGMAAHRGSQQLVQPRRVGESRSAQLRPPHGHRSAHYAPAICPIAPATRLQGRPGRPLRDGLCIEPVAPIVTKRRATRKPQGVSRPAPFF